MATKLTLLVSTMLFLTMVIFPPYQVPLYIGVCSGPEYQLIYYFIGNNKHHNAIDLHLLSFQCFILIVITVVAVLILHFEKGRGKTS